jgi:hypothetical protein
MQNLWNKFQAWLASKGGFTHVVGVLMILVTGAYAEVPAFSGAVNSTYNAMPPWSHKLVVLITALILWYRKSGKTVVAALFKTTDTTTTVKTSTSSLVPVIAVLCLFLFVGNSMAQTAPAQATPAPIQNMYAAGASYNAGETGAQAVAGTVLYAHLVANTSTYAFSVVDAVPNTLKPFTVNTNISAGVAQKVATVAGFDIFVPTAAGVSFNGTNTGWNWNTGVLASFKVKGSYYLMPTIRLEKSSVGGAGYQPIVGVLFGFGK